MIRYVSKIPATALTTPMMTMMKNGVASLVLAAVKKRSDRES
jgi:hypothetical protein